MQEKRALELDQPTFARLRDRIEAYSGIFLDNSRRRSLARQAAGRLARHGLRTWSEYVALLNSPAGEPEMTTLLLDVVNNETTFFRNPRHFRLLAESVLPELERARPAGVPLRIWSAGCSTGQEPYSIAITVAETFGLPPRRPVEILATDISQRALQAAERGLYSPRELQRVEAPYRKRYFHPEGSGYRVIPELRALVHAQPVNLVAEPFAPVLCGMDVVFCRNVTIYFRVETCRRLMTNLYRCLNEGGYLFIGFSETLWQIFDSFQRVQTGGVFFYRKGPAAPLPRPSRSTPPPRSVPGGRSVERPLFLGTAPVEQRPAHDAAQPETLEEDPARVHYNRGLVCLVGGAYEEALAAFQAALRVEPNLVEAYCAIAQVHANQGRYPEALRSCERALELDDLAEEAYLLRGLIYRQLGQVDQAIADLERAAYLNPSSPTAPFHLGNVFLAQARRDRALQSFRRAWRALLGRKEDVLIDGVPVHLLQQACRQHIEALAPAEKLAGAV